MHGHMITYIQSSEWAITSQKKKNMQKAYTKIKGLVHPKMKILSVFTHPHVVPTP